MSQRNVQILRQCAALLNVGDWDALLELYDPAVELRDLRHPPDMPEVVHGRRAIRLVVTRWSVPYDEFGAEVFEYIDADPWVICDTRWHVKAKGSDVPSEARVADAYEVKDGKIVRAIVGYPDVAKALKALGVAE